MLMLCLPELEIDDLSAPDEDRAGRQVDVVAAEREAVWREHAADHRLMLLPPGVIFFSAPIGPFRSPLLAISTA